MYRLTTSRRARAMTTCAALFVCAAQITPGLHAAAPPSQNASATPPPGLQQWSDSFDGQTLDAGKWENFALAGTPAKAQVGGGQLKLRGTANARAGIRSKTIFDGERLLAEATVVRTGTAAPPASSATLAVLFDDAGKSRIEWTLTGDGKLEAYDYTKGEAERLEGVAAGAATATAKLGIARRGADFYFTLNDQVLLHRAVSGVPPTFRVMLYGSGAGEVIWDGAQLAVQKTPAAAAPASVAATAPTGGAPTATAAANVWMDEFNGEKLDDAKWEPYTFDGGGGVKIEVKGGQLRQRGSGQSRSGIRTKETFNSNDFYVEATVNKPPARTPQPGESGFPPGFAVLTVLFNGTSFKRIEWIMTSDGQLQAWATINDRLERLDNNSLGTREKTPKLGVARRGNKLLFMINRQVGLERTVESLPTNFKVMLYGFGSTQNNWDDLMVQTPK